VTEHVEQAFELGGVELRLARRAFLPARPEVEDRIGVDVVDAGGSTLGELALAVGPGRFGIEVFRESIDVPGAPGAGLAMTTEHAAFGVIGRAGDVPVADVDHVQERLVPGMARPDRRLQEDAERAPLEQPRRHPPRRVFDSVSVVVLFGDEEVSDRVVLEEDPTGRIQEKVVLKTLRHEDVARLFLGCRWRSVRCRHLDSPR
jgi:hypothetical protein